MRLDLAERLVATLPAAAPGVFNPWRNACNFDAPGNGPAQRLERLAWHLNCDARWILVGEAPGYQGCRYSGIAFTSERLLMEGAIPRIPPTQARLSIRARPFSEPSATIVWTTLYRLAMAEQTILWNAVQLHPFAGHPWSNRTPTDAELAHGAAGLQLLQETFPTARLIAVGRQAEAAIAKAGLQASAAVRHPANGGAVKFAVGLQDVLATATASASA